MRRTMTITLTLAQYDALASAVALQDVTLEERGDERERNVLDRVWRKINTSWHRPGHTDGSAT